MSKKKILLLGGSGNLGRSILESCIFENIYAPSRKKIDLLDFFKIKNFLKKNKYNFIINCVANARMIDCEKKPQNAIMSNIETCLNLVRALKENNLEKNTKIIHLSSDAVYESKNGKYKETDIPNPYNVYGWSKLSAEYLVRAYTNHLIIRLRFYDKSKLNYKYSADDIFTSQIEISKVPIYINYLIQKNCSGIINIGEKKISDFQLYKKFIPNLKKFKRKDLIKITNINMCRDASLNLRKFNKIKKEFANT